jgi:hypothetical protein
MKIHKWKISEHGQRHTFGSDAKEPAEENKIWKKKINLLIL